MCSALQVVDQLVIPDRLRQETPTSPSLTRYVLSTRLSSMPCIGFEGIGDKLLKLPSSYRSQKSRPWAKSDPCIL